jgi:hypothetical protein
MIVGARARKPWAKPVRNEEIYEKRKAGATMAELGRAYKISRERVRQIVQDEAEKRGESIPVRVPKNRLTETDIQQYREGATSIVSLQERHGVGRILIRRWLVERGINFNRQGGRRGPVLNRRRPNPLTPEDTSNYRQKKASLGDLAEKHKTHAAQISIWLRRLGIQTHPPGNWGHSRNS